MDKIGEVIYTFFNPFVHWLTKLKYLFIIVVLLIFIDSRIGFTYHYFTQRKIEEVADISKIINDPLIDSTTKSILSKQRLSIISENRNLLPEIKKHKAEGGFWFFISYSFLHLMCILTCPWLLRIGVNQYKSRNQQNSEIIGVILVLSIEVFLLYCLCTYISQYINREAAIWVNIVLQIGAIYLTFYLSNLKTNSAKDVASNS